MCLAIPGRVLSIQTGTTPLMGRVSFSGIEKDICLEWMPDVKPGEYVIVHVGFAISKLDEEEALETLRVIREAGELQADLDPDAAHTDPPAPEGDDSGRPFPGSGGSAPDDPGRPGATGPRNPTVPRPGA
jgi:hydrogenase assembly chaperone HypC/HupF